LPFRDPRIHFQDILESIGHIDAFVAGMSFEAYRSDRKTRSAVERELQIITEAAIRLSVDAERLCPGPDWKGFRGMGNVLRHEYHRVDDRIVWNTIAEELPPLRNAILKFLDDESDTSAH
jgi:uncharacterized protein with HEPN domain